MRPLALVFVALAAAQALAQERPLPDPQVFAAEVRRRLQTDEERQSSYAYAETRTDFKLDGSGRPTKASVKVYESYPGLPGQPRWKRLVSVDGRALPPAELEKQDRERRKKVLEYAGRLDRQTERDRAEIARKRAKERAENEAAVDEAFRIYDIRMLGREGIEGHDTIAFSLTPRPGVKPRTREGKVFRHLAGKVWISETDYELVRIDIEALDTMSFGLGLLARVHKGSRMVFQRRKVNGEEWLPASASYTVSGRMLLLKRLRTGATSEFSNYRRFTVETQSTYAPSKK
jgi:hypothetical protein